jgi:hypothetical protein
LATISSPVQVKLLRVLQQREFERVGGTQTLKVDVRIVAATHRDLVGRGEGGQVPRGPCTTGSNVVAVTLPPLRERKSDVPAPGETTSWTSTATRTARRCAGWRRARSRRLLPHDWPGNIRELENAIERAVVLAPGNELTTDDSPPVLRGPAARGLSPSSLIPGPPWRKSSARPSSAPGDGEGSTTRRAEILGISVRKVQYRLKEYGGAGGAAPTGHLGGGAGERGRLGVVSEREVTGGGKRAPPSGALPTLQGAPMLGDDGVDDGQSQPGALRLGGEEGLEDAVAHLLGDARAQSSTVMRARSPSLLMDSRTRPPRAWPPGH